MKKNTKKTKKPAPKKKTVSKKKTIVRKKIEKKVAAPAMTKKWQPLRELALHTPYTMGYLSLMARRKQLKVKKVGRVWFSTLDNIHEFEDKMKKQKDARNENLRSSYKEKAEKVKISVMDDRTADKILKQVKKETIIEEVPAFTKVPVGNMAGDSIFDEIQSELQGVLSEIKNKEKRLRHNYLIYRGSAGSGGSRLSAADLQNRKENTEQISEKLISDVGKLLKTVNEIQSVAEEDLNGVQDAEIKIPRITEGDHVLSNHNRDNFLSVPYSYFPFDDSQNSTQKIPSHSKILLFFAGAMVFIAAVLLTLVVFGQ